MLFRSLEDKRATSLEAVLGERVEGGVEAVGRVFVEEMARELKGVEGVEGMREEDVK